MYAGALFFAPALVAAPAASAKAPSQELRIFEDSAGRTVAVPLRVERVFAAGPPAAIVLYTLAPERLLGWPRALSPEEAAWLPEPYRDLPAHGRLTGRGNEINLEAFLKLRPDLAVDIGSVGPTYASLADRVGTQTGVPTLLLGGRLDELPMTYRLLGEVLEVRERAEGLAAHIEKTLGDVKARIDAQPPDAVPRVYYARGPRGLSTALSGSINVEVLDFIGATNVAGKTQGRAGLAEVSLEHVLTWDPEVIVTVDRAFAEHVRSDPLWAGVSAVRQNRVHVAPQYPFPWMDFPPSVNRVLGVRWLASVLYPEVFPEPLEPITREFYRLFYHRTLGDDELARLLKP